MKTVSKMTRTTRAPGIFPKLIGLLGCITSLNLPAADSPTPELQCHGLLNPDRRVEIIQEHGVMTGKVYQKQTVVGSGETQRETVTSGSGTSQQTIASYRAGNPFQGGFRVRVVMSYPSFPKRQGQGNATVRVDGRISNDTIACEVYPQSH